jgi:hypothetical protein
MVRKGVWLFVSLLCSACAPKIEDVRAEVGGIVAIDRPMTLAVSKLGAAGFSCGGIDPVQCARQVRSCTEQVLVFHDSNFMVTRAEVTGVNCMYTP